MQRPESHSVHHARGVHAYNYANLPLVDLLFGTFRNPESFVATQGFWDGALSRIGAMLLGRDISSASESQAPAREAEVATAAAVAAE